VISAHPHEIVQRDFKFSAHTRAALAGVEDSFLHCLRRAALWLHGTQLCALSLGRCFRTVLSDRTDVKENAAINYLTVQLDNGETVRVDATRNADYRPGRKVIVKETTTSFFGLKKHTFKRYVDDPRPD
jgi:hypothetical protein